MGCPEIKPSKGPAHSNVNRGTKLNVPSNVTPKTVPEGQRVFFFFFKCWRLLFVSSGTGKIRGEMKFGTRWWKDMRVNVDADVKGEELRKFST